MVRGRRIPLRRHNERNGVWMGNISAARRGRGTTLTRPRFVSQRDFQRPVSSGYNNFGSFNRYNTYRSSSGQWRSNGRGLFFPTNSRRSNGVVAMNNKRGSTFRGNRGVGRSGGWRTWNIRNYNARGRRGMKSGRGRGAGRGGAVTQELLDAELEKYMGEDAIKSRLDSQLDSYFAQPAPETKSEPTSIEVPMESL